MLSMSQWINVFAANFHPAYWPQLKGQPWKGRQPHGLGSILIFRNEVAKNVRALIFLKTKIRS